MSGKGSKRRPTNKATFDTNYDRIFGKQTYAACVLCDDPVDEDRKYCNGCGDYVVTYRKELDE